MRNGSKTSLQQSNIAMTALWIIVLLLLVQVCCTVSLLIAEKARLGIRSGPFRQYAQRPTVQKPTVPVRHDACVSLLSGVIGFNPKESHHKNGRFLIMFSIATIGHFEALHDIEKHRPAETMWVPCEIWDDAARRSTHLLRKDNPVYMIGTWLSNKWTDHSTGEERKQFRFRVDQFLELDQFSNLFSSMQTSLHKMGIDSLSCSFNERKTSIERSLPSDDNIAAIESLGGSRDQEEQPNDSGGTDSRTWWT